MTAQDFSVTLDNRSTPAEPTARNARRAALAAVTAAALAAALAHAHKGATGIVKQRMDAMSALSDATKGAGRMIKGETVYDAESIAEYAHTIHRHSRTVVDYFPPGSVQPASEALPAIWQRWGEFEALAEELQDASAALAETAQTGGRSAVRAGFARLGKACKRCHENFRKKKKNH